MKNKLHSIMLAAAVISAAPLFAEGGGLEIKAGGRLRQGMQMTKPALMPASVMRTKSSASLLLCQRSTLTGSTSTSAQQTRARLPRLAV
jgi:hypothetical protein